MHVSNPHDGAVDPSSGVAAHEAQRGSDRPPDDDRARADEQRDPGADGEPEENVPAERVRAQPMPDAIPV